MKRTLLPVTILFFVVGLLQAQPQDSGTLLDPVVKHGTLPNGLTYYIRANKLPEKRAEFYIVHNVGAILEEDYQNGLAHFTEHMAFNGTTHFPGKSLLNYLETIGCKFGRNVNAFTSMDVTSYNISAVPVERESVIDSCLLILHDWSSFISFVPEEIDKERGVILEEWRTRSGAQSRLSDQLRPIMYAASKYGTRNVIGDTAVIKNFPRQAIIDFYHAWYRPDLQAVIVVGDIDANLVEEKVKELFSSIPGSTDKKDKTVFDIPDNDQPLVGIATDAEATQSTVTVYFKHNTVRPQDKSLDYLKTQMATSLINQMLNARISELTQKEDAPFINAYSAYRGYTAVKDAFMASATAKQNRIIPAFESLLTEAFRVQRHGFTPQELERAKANYLRSLESEFADRDKQKHDDYVWAYFEHFTENEPQPGIDFLLDMARKELPLVTIDKINQMAKGFVTDKNVVITVTAPDVEGSEIPDKSTLLKTFDKIVSSTITPYLEQSVGNQMMAHVPAAGKIKKEKFDGTLSATEWTLSNGIKVIFKQTDFKEDELMVRGLSPGGLSYVDDADYLAALLFPGLVGEMGLAGFSKPDLRKVLAGKRVGTSVSVSNLFDIVAGSGSPKDAETLFQMLHLTFTSPRFDEQVYNAYLSRIKASLANKALDPGSAFSDSVMVIVANHHPRIKPISAERLSEVTFEKVRKLYQSRFGDPASFTWLITGNIKPEVLKPLLETYLASLPKNNQKEKFIDRGVRIPEGIVTCHFDKGMKTPKTSVYANYTGKFGYTANEILYLNAIKHVLDIRYVESIREKEGGTYGVGVSTSYQLLPVKQASITLRFDTDPEKAGRMVELLHAEIKELLENGPSETDLQKAKEYFVKTFNENQKENGYWMGVLQNKYVENIDLTSNYVERVGAMTPLAIQQFAGKTFSSHAMVEVVMIPSKTTAQTEENQ
ncbi:MAG: insulinase family protein [Breznakibacter sp.]